MFYASSCECNKFPRAILRPQPTDDKTVVFHDSIVEGTYLPKPKIRLQANDWRYAQILDTRYGHEAGSRVFDGESQQRRPESQQSGGHGLGRTHVPQHVGQRNPR